MGTTMPTDTHRKQEQPCSSPFSPPNSVSPSGQLTKFFEWLRTQSTEDWSDVERTFMAEDLDLESIRTNIDRKIWKELGLSLGQFLRFQPFIKQYKAIPRTDHANSISDNE